MYMKKECLQIVIALLISTSIFADDTTTKASFEQPKQNPNNFFLGTEFFGFDLNTHVKNIKIHGNKFFWGFRFGYEYLKPKAFYAGFDILTASSAHIFKASKNGDHLSQKSDDTWFGSSELRLGYTFAPKKWLCSPFFGIGGYMVEPLFHHHGFKETLPYVALGARSKYEHSSIFNVGINFKIFHTIAAEEKYKQRDGSNYTRHPSFFGGEIGVPLTCYLGTKKRWDIQIEPYLLMLSFSQTQNVYGSRLLFGYRF